MASSNGIGRINKVTLHRAGLVQSGNSSSYPSQNRKGVPLLTNGQWQCRMVGKQKVIFTSSQSTNEQLTRYAGIGSTICS